MASPTPLLIGHEWKRTATTAPVLNPFTGKHVGEVHQGGQDEADAATTAAVSAFEPMRRLSSHARAQALTAEMKRE